MKCDIPWQKGHFSIRIPDANYMGTFHPNDFEAQKSPSELVEEALHQTQYQQRTFKQFLELDGPLLVIVNDGTRPTPTVEVLKVIGDRLLEKDVHFIIATGVHRAPTDEEYRFIFGDFYDRITDKIIVHDAREDKVMIQVGTTSRGTEFLLNKAAFEAHSILIIGSVEPHYFAGYTGGRKGLLPGISAYKTIEQNHKLALSPDAYTLNLKGNPVHEDMLEAVSMVKKPLYTIMTILDKHHSLFAVTAGEMESAFDDAVVEAEKVFVVPIKEKADVVISAAKYPMDVDLYQAQKALDNGVLPLKKGGTLILVGSCREGVGEEGFRELLSSSDTPEAVLESIGKNYLLGYHKAGKMAQIFIDAEVMAKTDLPDQLIASVFMKPVDNLQEAVDLLIAKQPDAKVALLPDGCVTVVKVENNEEE